MANVTTDVLLLRCRLDEAAGLREAAERFCVEAASALALHTPLQLQCVARGEDTDRAYLYARMPHAREMSPTELPALLQRWQALCPTARETDLCRLQTVQDLPGRAEGTPPTHHYAVETDPEEGWGDEMARWYQEEHLPGLSGVPGTVRARRFVNHDAGPSSHACYELVGADTLGSAPWLAVRGTAWSSRVRPHFTNTRRTMFRRLGP